MGFPKEFDENKYLNWHNSKWPTKYGLRADLEKFRLDLKKSSVKDLTFLSKLFAHYIKTAEEEYKAKQTGNKPLSAEYTSPLGIAVNHTLGSEYDVLFKSPSSIIDKLWRKNKDENSKRGAKKKDFVTLKNLPTRMTDLIRTEIIGGSLELCMELSQKFGVSNIADISLKKQYSARVKIIDVEPEMKMDKGYFAYHILVHFKSGLIVEVQIYSATIRKWRKLSHILYENTRRFGSKKPEFNSKESRLISLGHLFHLAECEIKVLEDELSSNEMK